MAVCAGKRNREIVRRGEDERHLPRRGGGTSGVKQTSATEWVFCFTRDREQTAGDTDGIAAVLRSPRVR